MERSKCIFTIELNSGRKVMQTMESTDEQAARISEMWRRDGFRTDKREQIDAQDIRYISYKLTRKW